MKPTDNRLKCCKCGHLMKRGQALHNSLWASIDFPGQSAITPERGQAVSRTGSPHLVTVMKCTGCGHSFTTNG